MSELNTVNEVLSIPVYKQQDASEDYYGKKNLIKFEQLVLTKAICVCSEVVRESMRKCVECCEGVVLRTCEKSPSVNNRKCKDCRFHNRPETQSVTHRCDRREPPCFVVSHSFSFF